MSGDVTPTEREESWQEVADRISRDTMTLLGLDVPEKEGYRAVKQTREANTRLWRFVTSTEGAWLDKFGSVPELVTDIAAALKINREEAYDLLIKRKLLTGKWEQLVRYCRDEVGIDPYPSQ